MAQQPEKKPGKRDYLKNFTQNLEGDYIYTGTWHSYAGQLPQSRYCLTLRAGAVLGMVLALLSGCIPAAGMTSSFYLLIPYAVEMAAAAVAFWKAMELQPEKDKLRTYRWEKTAAKLPSWLKVQRYSAAILVVLETVYLLLHGFGGKAGFTMLLYILQAAVLLLGRNLEAMVKNNSWIPEDSEE